MSIDQSNIDFGVRLKDSVIEAFQAEKYLEAGIIAFQVIEVLLRVDIEGIARGNGISETVIDEISNKEKSFEKLIIYLDMVKPDNNLSKQLRDLNGKRNQIIHNLLFSFKSEIHMKGELKRFCKDAIKLNKNLLSLLK